MWKYVQCMTDLTNKESEELSDKSNQNKNKINKKNDK